MKLEYRVKDDQLQCRIKGDIYHSDSIVGDGWFVPVDVHVMLRYYQSSEFQLLCRPAEDNPRRDRYGENGVHIYYLRASEIDEYLRQKEDARKLISREVQ